MRRGREGWTLSELLVVLAVGAMLLAAAVPSLAALRQRGRGAAAARVLAAEAVRQRFRAVARHRHQGLWFRRENDGWVWYEVEDGDGDGLRTADLRSGRDHVFSGPHRMGDLVAGMEFGFAPGGPFPQVPPKRGFIREGADPIVFGRSDIVSFSPLGRSSSGTFYLTDSRGEFYAVVLFGPTTRVRVWRYDFASRRWRR